MEVQIESSLGEASKTQPGGSGGWEVQEVNIEAILQCQCHNVLKNTVVLRCSIQDCIYLPTLRMMSDSEHYQLHLHLS